MNYETLANLLFPNIHTEPSDMEARYPKRDLPEGAKVTRFAPSPTGFVHFGGLFPTRISERLAHQSNGVFYLRIEDTDAKRKVEGAEANLIEVYRYYGIHFDEGVTENGEIGAYGPYRQSERAEIYHTYAKDLVKQGKAYPCFCTEEELTSIRAEQEAQKLTPGYYGKWAIWRDASLEQIQEKLQQNLPFVLRFRSEGDAQRKVKFTDLIKGNIEVTENDIDHVLLKSDGIPTYHFAHAVDDHLMGTTHVVRGEEWLPSLPFHLQLFQALGFKMPKYLHISQLMKLEGGSKKKLSKRNNEASMQFYKEAGYPAQSVVEYIMTLLNSNYEEWRAQNWDKPFTDFPFSIKKMSASGCLFDFDKLNDVSKNTICRMTAEQVYDAICAWAKEFDPDFFTVLAKDADYAKRILSIGRGIPKPRKDLTTWKDAKPYMALFYDTLFERKDAMPEGFTKEQITTSLSMFLKTYDTADDMTVWFNKIKEIAQSLGFAPETKLYKQNPQDYPGHVGDISSFIRIALTGQVNSPDLYTVMQILGPDRVQARIAQAIELL